MISEVITIDRAIEVLNRAVVADKEAMTTLVQRRVICNDALAKDPTIQVVGRQPNQYGVAEVGLLGILNGLFGMDENGMGAIGADFELKCSCPVVPPDTAKVDDRCESCGSKIVLGELIEFVNTQKAKE